MAVFRIEVLSRSSDSAKTNDPVLSARLAEAGLTGAAAARQSRLFFLEGQLQRAEAQRIAERLLVDPVTETFAIADESDAIESPAGVACEVHRRPGVMDPVADSTLAELLAEGCPVDSVRTARRYVVSGDVADEQVRRAVNHALANDCIEEVFMGTAGVRPAPKPPVMAFDLRSVQLRDLDDAGLQRLSRDGHLFLSLDEMKSIQDYFRRLDREPTDLELETLAQTWSEHCVHKTLKSAMVYRGAPMPGADDDGKDVELRYGNLLRDTIAKATEELIAEKRGPECLSVFKDNAGVIGFDDEYGVAFKVETHNHPSAIEPYGGAATGVGGVIRDVMGVGLGAKPVANTDVFCVAPSDWPIDKLPKGVLHPHRVLRGIVSGVADYGNRMGIPTVNGAVYFDPRYLGNPLVYCGCVGMMPRNMVEKAAQPGDLVVVIGGRTGRDGIHGATFSSAELTDTHADEFSHAVQIGNAITEKRCLDAMLRARDYTGGCLYTATTDCGAGGLSSAVGEMGEEIGVEVELRDVPLKYAGLRYDEIWISEAQERMVLSVPPANLDAFMAIMREEEVEATVIGTFGSADPATGQARLIVRYDGTIVGEVEMAFLHGGVPKLERQAEWRPTSPVETPTAAKLSAADVLDRLQRDLSGGNIVGKHWIIRQYDHEVQGGSAVKSLCGPGAGPSDAAVLRPRFGSKRAVAVGCGMAPWLSDIDPYWMAAASIDEALRNVVAVGGDPRDAAVLDNFCWGRSDDTRQLGALVRACQACYDVAMAFGVPFVSGKDSLNNEYALEAGDVEPLIETLKTMTDAGVARGGLTPTALPEVERLVRDTGRLRIVPTLLISAISVIEDVEKCVTPDLKRADSDILLVGGQNPIGFDLGSARATHDFVAAAIRARLVAACHDVSDGGWATALAEMAVAGDKGAVIDAEDATSTAAFAPLVSAYVVEPVDAAAFGALAAQHGVSLRRLGRVSAGQDLRLDGSRVSVGALRSAWSSAS